MGSHAGDALHYHGAPPNRYGHRHAFLSIMHEHEVRDLVAELEASLSEATARIEKRRALPDSPLVTDDQPIGPDAAPKDTQ